MSTSFIEPEEYAAPTSLRPSAHPVLLDSRPTVKGKFLWVGDRKFYVRGVTYGTFRPNQEGQPFPDPQFVKRDFAMMAANGINSVRTYSVPPGWLLDLACMNGLRILVGLQAERHYAFLDDQKQVEEIRGRVRRDVRACAGHPAVLCYTVANEIPASIVRWHGARRIERFIEALFWIAHEEDAAAIVGYANYPSTEYLDLPFLDLVCFNVYLESREYYEPYLARLQNLSGHRPLLMTEIGTDSRRNGKVAQAISLDWQVRTAFAEGCAGVFAYAWTDEWHCGGHDVTDWDFGLTTRGRKPKRALAAVRKAFTDVPFGSRRSWPRISVVVCSYNGKRTIRDCLDGLRRVRYPDYEVIVVDDGSTDGTGDIARSYGFRVLSAGRNRGLSAARNMGWTAASGSIVAYIDDDAFPDPDWLSYLAAVFMKTDYAGVGGPNIPVPSDGTTASCVARAPGGPAHVLLSDREAEHIPGCNMAFRKACLEAVGGFDPQFRQAGDDVDLCWRIRALGGRLGFSPAAMVWHHYRNSVRAYWRQQVGYGKAEALLERKWPEKHNSNGYITWSGSIYGDGLYRLLQRARGRIYQGTWGTAPFARIYQSSPNLITSLPLIPEWQLTSLALVALCAIGLFWKPLLFALPMAFLMVGIDSQIPHSRDSREFACRF
ncbi:MAG: glycosyl transferase [Acidobacteria bacterium]|nr:MAG: glycosyl transferase [Acidobacteriota bacterium]